MSRAIVFEPFFCHVTPIAAVIEIPLARWHIESDTASNTEMILRKALEKLPHWTKNFHWTYVEDIQSYSRCWLSRSSKQESGFSFHSHRKVIGKFEAFDITPDDVTALWAKGHLQVFQSS